jgi:hypothetical protein
MGMGLCVVTPPEVDLGAMPDLGAVLIGEVVTGDTKVDVRLG